MLGLINCLGLDRPLFCFWRAAKQTLIVIKDSHYLIKTGLFSRKLKETTNDPIPVGFFVDFQKLNELS